MHVESTVRYLQSNGQPKANKQIVSARVRCARAHVKKSQNGKTSRLIQSGGKCFKFENMPSPRVVGGPFAS